MSDGIVEAWLAEQCEDYWADEEESWRELMVSDDVLFSKPWYVTYDFLNEWFEYSSEEDCGV